jgi:hypothetical protein
MASLLLYDGDQDRLGPTAWRCPVNRIPTEIIADLDRDAAALIALWIEIYGGDPIPAQVEASPATAALAAAMVAQLRSEFTQSTGSLPDGELSARLGRLGLELERPGLTREAVVSTASGFVCVRGPAGEPGCCVRMPIHFASAE